MLYSVVVNDQTLPRGSSSTKNDLFVRFWKGRNIVRHLTSGQKQKQSIRSVHTFFCLSPFCFLPPLISSFHTSCFLALILSLFSFLSHGYIFSPSAVFFFFFKCVCVIDLLCRRLPGESLKWSFLLMNQTPLIEHGWLWDDITHMRTLWPSHSPQSFIHNNRHNQLFRMRDEGRRGVSE